MLKILLIISLILFLVYLIIPKNNLLQNPKLIVDTFSQINDTKEKEFKPNLPNLDKIFSDDRNWVATLSAQKLRTIIATGDIIPARSVNYQVISRNDFRWPYLNTANLVRHADITFVNLETPLIKNCPVTQEGMIFCGDFRNIEGLNFAGVDIASLANNHAGNYRVSGVKETVKLLNDNGIDVTGINGPQVKVIRGINFAFLGYNDITVPQVGIANTDEEKIKKEITQAKQIADVVVVTFHWGVEYRDQPDDRQIYLGHLSIDAGADLVIGNHPHWIQPVEIYQDKLITYAHGNYIFDQMWSEKTKLGVIGRYTFFDNKLIDVQYLPIYIEDYGQARFLEGIERKEILEYMKNESLKLNLRFN